MNIFCIRIKLRHGFGIRSMERNFDKLITEMRVHISHHTPILWNWVYAFPKLLEKNSPKETDMSTADTITHKQTFARKPTI